MLLMLVPTAYATKGQSNQTAQAKRKPNIVFILADDLGYADVTPYGQKQIKTPNIDRLATEGIKFTQAYAGSYGLCSVA